MPLHRDTQVTGNTLVLRGARRWTRRIHGCPEQQIVWDLVAMLERQLVAVVSPTYKSEVEMARARLMEDTDPL
jgi:hypothetical protein